MIENSSTDRATPSQRQPRIQALRPNSVGLVGVVFMVVATAAPISAMTGNLPVALGFGNETGAPAGYLVATVVLSVFALGYTAMARHITTTGAFYGYISHGLGRGPGMASGLLAVIAYMLFEPCLIGLLSSFGHATLKAQFGVDVPWIAIALVALAVNAVLAHFDLNLAARVLGVLLIGELAVLTAMAVGVLVQGGGPDGLPLEPINPVNAFDGVNPGLGLFFAFWSWVGFESTAMYGEESRDPRRVIPIATMITVVGIGLFYVFVSWMAVSGLGLAEAVALARNDPFAIMLQPTETYLGPWAVDAFQWLLITGSFACALAFHNCASRYLYAIGREGILHRGLGRAHARHGSPHTASAVQSIIATAIVLLFWFTGQDPYQVLFVLLALTGTMAILIVQGLCSFAVIGYFRRNHRESRHWFRTLTAPLLGGIAFIALIVLLFMNLETAAGTAAGSPLFPLIPWLVLGVFLFGLLLAAFLRATRPDKYAIIGRVVLSDSQERAEPVAPPGDENLQ
ncbi:APC family permease [Actinomadura sp. 3N407]|uniref:APC family permease n=1 Tax=Actinomadura sp. 3N407 TaxID=3457423 RepID=UPI003FCDACA1